MRLGAHFYLRLTVKLPRKVNTILTVSGYFKQDATETAADKMAKVIAAEGTTGTLRMKDAGHE